MYHLIITRYKSKHNITITCSDCKISSQHKHDLRCCSANNERLIGEKKPNRDSQVAINLATCRYRVKQAKAEATEPSRARQLPVGKLIQGRSLGKMQITETQSFRSTRKTLSYPLWIMAWTHSHLCSICLSLSTPLTTLTASSHVIVVPRLEFRRFDGGCKVNSMVGTRWEQSEKQNRPRHWPWHSCVGACGAHFPACHPVGNEPK